MSEDLSVPGKQDDRVTEKDKRENNGLGISPAVYSLGNAARTGLIFTGVTVAALTTLLIANRKNERVIRAAHLIPNQLHKLDHYLGELLDYMSRGFKGAFVHKKPVLPDLPSELKWSQAFGTAFSIAFPLSHIVQIPWYALGLKKGREAVKKYQDLEKENAKLAAENDDLRIVVNQGISEGKSKPASVVADIPAPQLEESQASILQESLQTLKR